MADISKIMLPSGNAYSIKDEVARQAIAGGLAYIIAWNGESVPDVTKIPQGIVVTYNGTDYTGTLTVVAAQAGAFYFVKSSIPDVLDAYDEYTVIKPNINDSTTWFWEKIGTPRIDLSSLGNLAYKDNVTLNKGAGDAVLGEGTTFTAEQSGVTFAQHTKDKVLGEGTTFSTTVVPATTNVKATPSGIGVGADGTAAAITGFGAHATDTFVKSVSAETNKKLVVTSIIPTEGTESVSKVTKTASKLVTTTIPNVTANSDVTIPNVTDNTDKELSFALGTGNDSETLIISGSGFTGNTYTASKTTLGTAISASKVTLGTAITAATGAVDSNGAGSDIVTGVTISDKTVAKAATTAVTVATGATDANGTGDSIVTGVTVGQSAEAITALGTPTTSNCLTGVKITSQGSVALATGAPAGAGVISVATGIDSASTSANADDKVDAITELGAGTAAAQSITVGANDKVTVAKYNDLSVSIS